ncbi:MAG: hypothetical protein M0R80_23670 [Proteobacteria bacterium]|jgi:hypothetical protein|nr:hypothetical protein [Pseudomonadota bacterium]
MKFDVEVIRIGYRRKLITVEAKDRHDAKNKADRLAPDLEFPGEHDCEHASQVVGEVREVA